MSGIVFMLIVLVTLFGIIPLATKKGMMNAVQQDEDDGEPVSLRPAEAACEGDGFRSIEDSGVVESEITEINRDAHQHDGGSHMDGAARRITQDYIDSVREKRRKAIRRRRAVAGILAVLAVVFAAVGVMHRVFLLCALIPAAVLAAVLFLGAHAASQARKWEDTVHAVKNRPAWESTRRHTLNHNIHMVSAGARDFGGPSEEFETETDAMSQMEIQEALTLAIREQGTAIRRRSLKIRDDIAAVAAEELSRSILVNLRRTELTQACREKIANLALIERRAADGDELQELVQNSFLIDHKMPPFRGRGRS